MPLTPKGKKIMGSMESEYGEKKGEQVFYASKNKGTIKGVEGAKHKALEKAKDGHSGNPHHKDMERGFGEGHSGNPSPKKAQKRKEHWEASKRTYKAKGYPDKWYLGEK